MATKWIENRSVHVISSIINSDISNVERRVKGYKEELCMGCPHLIKMYNKNKVGVNIRYGTEKWEIGRNIIISL